MGSWPSQQQVREGLLWRRWHSHMRLLDSYRQSVSCIWILENPRSSTSSSEFQGAQSLWVGGLLKTLGSQVSCQVKENLQCHFKSVDLTPAQCHHWDKSVTGGDWGISHSSNSKMELSSWKGFPDHESYVIFVFQEGRWLQNKLVETNSDKQYTSA
jgi:hypothetical protein